MGDSSILAEIARLFADMRAADVMATPVTSLPPEKKVSQAKEMMRVKRISGIPVVDESTRLIGLLSVADLINALEQGRVEDQIRDLMTRDVVSVRADAPLSDVVKLFDTYGYGRFPVVDGDGVLLGIISRTDILDSLLEKFGLIYIHDQKRSSTLDSGVSRITGERLRTDDAEFRYSIDTSDIDSAGIGSSIMKQFLVDKGYPADITRRAGVAAYEAETNVVIHSHGSGEILCFLREDRIIIKVVDNGVGIEDLDKAMEEGYSTAPDYIRERGFGSGMGIPNMKRFVDKLVILSEKNVGTQVEMILHLPERAPASPEWLSLE